MEFNFEWRRLVLLAALLGGFAFIGGFSVPQTDEDHSPARARKAWFYCVLLFATGAASASVVDHYTGGMSYSNLRSVYILFGALLMVAGVLWLKLLKRELVRPPPLAGMIVYQGPCRRAQAVASRMP
ncbi:hypothetical protein [Prosthecobacter fluviatilis]|uniref:Uncharacterized protein n=1 Tax=Prosthecobacter fluviatilis TaxID=445931 RepID=A0ABW0KUA8_9BACT